MLVAADGKRHRADLSLATWTIEQHGPLRACVRIEGRHGAEDGSVMFRYIACAMTICSPATAATLDVARLVADRVASEHIDGWSDHIRDVGWPLNLLMTVWETTGEEKYLDAAAGQWQTLQEAPGSEAGFCRHAGLRSLHGGKCKRCVSGPGLLHAGLDAHALARYHQATGDPEVLRAISIGLDQMIHECWDEESKSFYATACTHGRESRHGDAHPTVLLGSLAFAHAIKQTGNEEHRRIFREAFNTAMKAGQDQFGARLCACTGRLRQPMVSFHAVRFEGVGSLSSGCGCSRTRAIDRRKL